MLTLVKCKTCRMFYAPDPMMRHRDLQPRQVSRCILKKENEQISNMDALIVRKLTEITLRHTFVDGGGI